MQLFLSKLRVALRWLALRSLPAVFVAAPAVFLAVAVWGFRVGAGRRGDFQEQVHRSATGPRAKGTKKHEEPLEGSKSLAQLVDLIGKTMPEDDPGTLSKERSRGGGAITCSMRFIRRAPASGIARRGLSWLG